MNTTIRWRKHKTGRFPLGPRCQHLTRVQVLILLGEVLVLVHPLPVAFEEDLQRGCGPTAQLNGVAFDDVGILRLLDEVRQGALRRG